MHRFIGRNKETKPAVSLDDTSKRIQGRGDALQEKINNADRELLVIKDKLKSAKGAVHNKYVLYFCVGLNS